MTARKVEPKEYHAKHCPSAAGSTTNLDEGGTSVLFEILKDYVLLVIGVTFGFFISSLCHIAAEADRRTEKMRGGK